MSAVFSGSTLTNAASPITAYPFTIGCLVMPTATPGAAAGVYSVCDTGAATNYWALALNSANGLRIDSNAAGSVQTTTILTVTNSHWYYTLLRFISATNRRASVLSDDGTISSAQNTVSSTPTSIARIQLGDLSSAGLNFTGRIAEFWYTNTDIQPDGGALENELLWQLALGGPFSVPHIAKDIIEYHGMRAEVLADNGPDDYYGAFGRQIWTAAGTVSIGPHPPLPYWYVKPGQNLRLLPI